MLVVKIELHSAITGKTTTLCQAVIYNDGSGSKNIGNYKVLIGGKGQALHALLKKPWRRGAVTKFPRAQRNAWYLLQEALAAVMPRKD